MHKGMVAFLERKESKAKSLEVFINYGTGQCFTERLYIARPLNVGNMMQRFGSFLNSVSLERLYIARPPNVGIIMQRFGSFLNSVSLKKKTRI
jgi:hypothetical protein